MPLLTTSRVPAGLTETTAVANGITISDRRHREHRAHRTLVAEEDPGYLTAQLLEFLTDEHATAGMQSVMSTE
jgi:hypothetical protein